MFLHSHYDATTPSHYATSLTNAPTPEQEIRRGDSEFCVPAQGTYRTLNSTRSGAKLSQTVFCTLPFPIVTRTST